MARWTRDQLRAKLRSRGLSAAGLKAELFARLQEDDARVRDMAHNELLVQSQQPRRSQASMTSAQNALMIRLATEFGEALPISFMRGGTEATTRAEASIWSSGVYRKYPQAAPPPWHPLRQAANAAGPPATPPPA